MIGPQETPEIGGAAIDTLKTDILKGNTADVISGATITSQAVSAALNIALSLARGEEIASTMVQDGEYITRAMGYKDWIYITTTFRDGKIASCVLTSHDETMGIGNYGASRMPERIAAAQSLNVDTVSGATVSSNAVKQAVRLAIKEADGTVSDFETEVAREVVNEKVELHTEVVVVGAGTAGLVLGTKLAEEGVDVLLFEKMEIPGGSMGTTYSGIMNSYSQVTANHALGAEQNSASWNMELLLPIFKNYITPEYDRYDGEQPYQRVMLEAAGEVVDWFRDMGMGFSSMGYFEGGTQYGLTPYLAPGTYNGGAGYGAMYLADRLAKLETPIEYNTEVTELITNDQNEVIGVKAISKNGKEWIVYADAVVLATGGFAENPEMIAQHYPQYAGIDFNANPGSTGDGILMAQEIGAGIETMGRELGAFMSEYGTTYSLAFMHQSTPGILVDTTGYEFANIMSSNHHVLSHALVNPAHGGEFYYVYDEQSAQSTKDYDAYGFSYKSLFDRPSTSHYDTVAEASEALDIPGLQEAIDKNNAAALAGEKNEFGRGNLPYIETRDGIWITRVMPTLYLTTGGLVADTQAHVIDTEGNIIKGLYGVGDVVGSIEEKDGKRYGNGFDQALAYGYVAAEVIIDELKEDIKEE
ncbi:hypothetical protein AN640_00700 [Candidatus Epulonipiscium fishelsonii]|uniref:Uncharacterized protein n=1 Tax=Candidatus Epulonipiscium fishelsonii TaxID=77094 RepID=A0ACC8XJ92_9FIRM|nr:hypothetical protein AN640_00700 [Epulopiscium sp. SCG-D08WGA-EpuloA1]